MKFQNLTPTQRNLAKATFIGMLQRDMGFTNEQAEQEFKFLVVNRAQMLREYYTVQLRRVGATKTLNRAQRVSVYDTFENALNHATF